MDEVALRLAVRRLDDLSHGEYRQGLKEILADSERDPQATMMRLGRLIGVMMKEPFATPQDLTSPSTYSHAYRAWNLDSEDVVGAPARQQLWQYRMLEKLRQDPDVTSELGRTPPSVFALAQEAHHERGFFAYLAISCRKYLCRDPRLRAEIESSVEAARRSGLDLRNVTPETIVSGFGVSIGVALVQNIPSLELAGAPVIAGLVLLIFNIGLDAFCGWASQTPATRDVEQ